MREQKQGQFLSMLLQSSEWFLGAQLQCLRTVQNSSGYDVAIPPERLSTVQGMLLAILPERFRTVQNGSGYAAAMTAERFRTVHSMMLQSLLNGSERFLGSLSDERFRTVQNGSELYACSVRCLLDGLQNGSERFRGMGSNASGTVRDGSGACSLVATVPRNGSRARGWRFLVLGKRSGRHWNIESDPKSQSTKRQRLV